MPGGKTARQDVSLRSYVLKGVLMLTINSFGKKMINSGSAAFLGIIHFSTVMDHHNEIYAGIIL